MKSLIAVFAILLSGSAFAQSPQSREGVTGLERLQLDILQKRLKDHTGIIANIRFRSIPVPIDVYYSATGVSQKLANLTRTNSDQVFGAMPRQVVVDLGWVSYSCTGAVSFVGGVEEKNLRYAGLINCDNPVFTKEAEKMDTACFAAKDVKDRQEKCGEFVGVLVPSALSFEDRIQKQ